MYPLSKRTKWPEEGLRVGQTGANVDCSRYNMWIRGDTGVLVVMLIYLSVENESEEAGLHDFEWLWEKFRALEW